MNRIEVKFLGSGDAFGSGGRLQPCIHVKYAERQFLLDCGPTALIGMRRFNVEPNDIDTIIISHFHGDHYCGIPLMILDAQLVSKRTQPLTIVGPQGIRKRIEDSMEIMFTHSSKVQQNFAIEYIELIPGIPQKINELEVTAFTGEHPSGGPSLIVRVKVGSKIITYTGDTDWTDNLIPAAEGADLFISEAYFFEKRIKFHMVYQTLLENIDKLKFKKMILTHMSQEMLRNVDKLEYEQADDGKVFYV